MCSLITSRPYLSADRNRASISQLLRLRSYEYFWGGTKPIVTELPRKKKDYLKHGLIQRPIS
jgi:hypothetical protein